MWRVGSKQMSAFAQAEAERFIAQLLPKLRRAVPHAAVVQGPEDALRERAQQALVLAAAHDIELEDDVERLAEFVAVYGADLERPELAWLAEVLRDASLDGSDKVDRLDAIVLHEHGGW